MASIVLGIGTSHSPLLPLTAAEWVERASDDKRNPRLNLSDGRFLTYEQLEAEVQGRYANVATLDSFLAQWARCQRSLDRLADELAAANPDVVVIVGDDQEELFRKTNIPAVAIYYGREIVMRPLESMDVPRWLLATGVGTGYAMDIARRYPAAPDFGRFLIEQLVEEGIDVGAVSTIEDSSVQGLGHAYGFVIQRLLGGRGIPVVPVLLNTYYPPNRPTPTRCYQIGQALRRAIERGDRHLRVVVAASGGLSHFVCDEELDRRVLAATQAGDADVLRHLPRGALNSGSSEINNWITVAGAMEGRACRWAEYVPVHRTPAGTGIGLAFLAWG
jgi:OH-DDVA oxygenase